LRQVEWREEHALDEQAEREAERGRPGAEDQIKRRTEDQVHLGNADRMMRQDFEEAEDERRRGNAARGERGDAAILADRVERHLGGQSEGGRGGCVREDDLGAVDDAGFDMHGLFLPAPIVHLEAARESGPPVHVMRAGLLTRASSPSSAFPGNPSGIWIRLTLTVAWAVPDRAPFGSSLPCSLFIRMAWPSWNPRVRQ
jgi:hypothetical protein